MNYVVLINRYTAELWDVYKTDYENALAGGIGLFFVNRTNSYLLTGRCLRDNFECLGEL